MESLITLYKIGYGPSSSHTMGPANAANYFKKLFPNANAFKVTLYGSLALTGKGHMTDKAIIDTLSPIKTDIVWNLKNRKIEHPNTMDFEAFNNNKLLGSTRIFSIGGGSIVIKGQKPLTITQEVYKEQSATEIIELCNKKKWSLVDYVNNNEDIKKLDSHLKNVWETMQNSIKIGLSSTGEIPGGLHLPRKALNMFNMAKHSKNKFNDTLVNKIMGVALAVAEANATGEIIVTAPTCGAAGVLPSVLWWFATQNTKTTSIQIVDALKVAGVIGNIVRTKSFIAGAAGGCQAEIGVASAMAAAAYAWILGLKINKIFDAAAIALEHHLGLTCDPVLGLVQVPCIERNAISATKAISAAMLASSYLINKIMGFDDIVQAMTETANAMNPDYKETSIGGLANIFKLNKSKKF